MVKRYKAMLSLIKIEVTPDIAAKIRFLAESGIFSIKTGTASLNFKDSELKSIKTELYSYPQPHTVDSLTTIGVLSLGKE